MRRGARPAALAVIPAVMTVAVTVALAGAAVAQTSSNPVLASARLQGTFRLSGRLIVAAHVLGERLGQTVSRNWQFGSFCPDGACSAVALIRQRAGGSDSLTLTRRSPGFYVGTGSFYAPLQCGTAIYPAGERVPFAVTVRITGAFVQNGQAIAGGIAATYTNGYRVNLTPCVAVLGHDAAAYQGGLIGPARDAAVKRR